MMRKGAWEEKSRYNSLKYLSACFEQEVVISLIDITSKRRLKYDWRGASSDTMMYIVKILYAAAPMSFNVEDYDGMDALEYAIDSELAMQRA